MSAQSPADSVPALPPTDVRLLQAFVDRADAPSRYRVREERRSVTLSSQETLEAARHVAAAIVRDSSAGLVPDHAAVDVLLEPHAAEPIVRSLFVEQVPGAGVVEAYHNEDGELDCFRLLGPDVFVSCNPGRREINYRVGGTVKIELASISSLLFPASLLRKTIGAETPWTRVAAGGDGQRCQMYRSGETDQRLLVVAPFGVPRRAVLLDRSNMLVVTSFRYARAGPDAPVGLHEVHRSTMLLGEDSAQVTVLQWTLSQERPVLRAPPRLDVLQESNLFEFVPGSTNGIFRGRLDVVGIPEPLKGLIEPRTDPRPVWSQ